MLATRLFESLEHFESPPNLLVWFYIFKVKNKTKIFGYLQLDKALVINARCLASRCM